MKKLLLFLSILFSVTVINAQTYVSGGIYSNTTWTKAASPYIVTDTVVVFPGVTLTIEPGVTVKFDDTSRLEVRQAKIIAIGTALDSITFTSNNPILKLGNWGGITFNIGKLTDSAFFEFCNIKYADAGMIININSFNTISIKNSDIKYNLSGFRNFEPSGALILNYCTISDNKNSGIYCSTGKYYYINKCILKNNLYGINIGNSLPRAIGTISNSIIDSNEQGIANFYGLIENCTISNSKRGIINGYGKVLNCKISKNSEYGIFFPDTTIGCSINNNKIGINTSLSFHIEYNEIYDNEIGILVSEYDDPQKISCNKICNNVNYDIRYEGAFIYNISFPNNYFCTPDSASTRPKIFDGYVDVKYGLVNFMPLDTSCYKTLGIKENKVTKQFNTKLYPNPFTASATLEFDNPQAKAHQFSLFNTLGQSVYSIENIKSNSIQIDRKGLQNGMYYYRLTNVEGIVGSGKMIIE